MGGMGTFRCAVLLLLGGLVALSGCGGGGGDGDGGGAQGYKFKANNMVNGASAGANAVGIFPEISSVSLGVVDAVQTGAASRAAAGKEVEIPMTGLCVTGGAKVDWVDQDDDNALSAGDTVTLTFTGCEMEEDGGSISGTVVYSFSNVDLQTNNITATLTLNLAVQDVVDGQTENETLKGSFPVQVTPVAGTPAVLNVLYGGANRSDVLTTTLGGKTTKFGCFDVTHVFNAAGAGDDFTVQARGIANVGGKIMQIGSYFGTDMWTFKLLPGFDEYVPIAGSLTLLSFDGRPSASLPSCKAVGSPGQVDSDDTYLTVSATGDGFLQINLYDRNNQLTATQNVAWTELY